MYSPQKCLLDFAPKFVNYCHFAVVRGRVREVCTQVYKLMPYCFNNHHQNTNNRLVYSQTASMRVLPCCRRATTKSSILFSMLVASASVSTPPNSGVYCGLLKSRRILKWTQRKTGKHTHTHTQFMYASLSLHLSLFLPLSLHLCFFLASATH